MQVLLPPELWLKIFSLLSPRDLAAAACVCREWRSVALMPHLWTRVRVSKRRLIKDGFHQLFSLPRFLHMRKLDYSRAWLAKQQWREVLAQVVNCGRVEELDISHARLKDVARELVGEAVSKVVRVKICSVQGLHLPTLVEKACQAGSRLEHLHLEELNQPPDNTSLRDEDPIVLANKLSCLSSLELAEPDLLTHEQMAVLLDCSSRTGTKVGGYLSTEEDEGLIRFLPRMHRANVMVGSSWQSAPLQWTSLFSSLSLPSSRLKHLELEAVNASMAGVDPSLLSCSFSRLSTLRLSGLQLSPQQWAAILKEVPSSSLQSLSLRMIGLSSLPASLLTTSLPSLSSLSLHFTALSSDQWETLLPVLASSPKLRTLSLCQVDLSCLPPCLLLPLVDHLLHLDLSDSRLPAHLLQPLISSLPSSSLRSMGLAGQDLREVGRDCLALGLVSLERVGLKKARLGDEQLRALLSCSLGRTRLRQIDLSGVNLSAVPGDLLALAISRLREADLACTWLTKTQLSVLVAQVCRFTKLEHLRLQAATAALLTREMRGELEEQLYLSVF